MYIQIKVDNEFEEEVMMEILKDKFKNFRNISIDITGLKKSLKYSSQSSKLERANPDNRKLKQK